MRSAKSTLLQERDRDGVNKVSIEGKGREPCIYQQTQKQGLTQESAIICGAKGY